MTRRARALLTALLLTGPLAAGACDAPKSNEAVAAKTKAIERAPATKSELETFAAAFIQAIEAGDVEALDKMIDFEGVVALVAPDAEIPKAAYEALIKGFRQGAKATGFLYDWASYGGAVRVSVLSYNFEDSAAWVSLRVLFNNGGFDHLRLRVSREASGEAKIVDFFALSSGKSYSDRLRPILEPMLRDLNRSGLSRTIAPESPLTAHMDTISQMGQFSAKNDYESWMNRWSSLPEEVRFNEEFLGTRVAMAAELSDEVYTAAIQDLRTHHPKSASAAFSSLDYYVMKKDWDGAVAGLNTIIAATDADAYLTAMRANLLLQGGKATEALVDAEAAIKAEPTLEDPYWTVVDVALLNKDHTQARDTMLEMHRSLGIEFTLEGNEIFADFVASTEYAEFKKRYAEQAAAAPAP